MRAEQLLTTTSSKENIMASTTNTATPAVTVEQAHVDALIKQTEAQDIANLLAFLALPEKLTEGPARRAASARVTRLLGLPNSNW
jgi:hypothetical protein